MTDMSVQALKPRVSIALGASIAWVILIAIVAVLAALIAPYAVNAQDHSARLVEPFGQGLALHPLGTDQIGRDVFSRLVFATQASLGITALGALASSAIGVSLGLLASWFKGPVDAAVMALADMQAALPYFVFAICVLTVVEPTIAVYALILGFAGWEKYARLVRVLLRSALSDGYAESIRALGASTWRLYTTHIAPNILSSLVVQVTLAFPGMLILETGLSFLGLGLAPPHASLGGLVAEGQPYIFQAWWLSLAPAAIIFLTGLSISVIGERIRGALDLG